MSRRGQIVFQQLRFARRWLRFVRGGGVGQDFDRFVERIP